MCKTSSTTKFSILYCACIPTDKGIWRRAADTNFRFRGPEKFLLNPPTVVILQCLILRGRVWESLLFFGKKYHPVHFITSIIYMGLT